MPVISARQRQEAYKFKAKLGNLARPCPKIKKFKKETENVTKCEGLKLNPSTGRKKKK